MVQDFSNNSIIMICKDKSQKVVDNIQGCRVIFKGSNNRITFHENSRFNDSIIVLIENCIVELGEGSVFRSLSLYGLESEIKIGKGFSCWSLEIRAEERGTAVTIGDGCMFSKGINIYPTDCHTIFDVETRQAINKGGSIFIGNHVWCGFNVIFLKNSSVGADSIVAAGSMINKNLDQSNSLIAGSPAKIIKSGVNWDRRSPSEYK